MTYEPLKEAGSIWSMLPKGTHNRIVPLLKAHADTVAALAAATANPANATAVKHLIDVVTRQTGNCVGQALLHQALAPGDATHSIFKGFKPGTEAAMVGAIAALTLNDLGLKDPPSTKDAKLGPVFAISRYAGRCMGQEIGHDLIGLVKKLIHV